MRTISSRHEPTHERRDAFAEARQAALRRWLLAGVILVLVAAAAGA